MPTLTNDFVSAAAFAATDGHLLGQAGSEAVKVALSGGLWAARHGRAIPLPVLLDVTAGLAVGRRRAPGMRALQGSRLATIAAYDSWLTRFWDVARRTVGMRTFDFNGAIGSLLALYLPPLLAAWPRGRTDEQSVSWLETYRELLGGAELNQSILAAWSGRRTEKLGSWGQWFPFDELSRGRDPEFSHAAKMWGNYGLDSGQPWLHENFDHAGASYYLNARDPEIQPDQVRRIQHLRNWRQNYQSIPLTISYEEQDPLHGVVTLQTLCSGDYGLFKVGNQMGPFISSNPRSRPPQRVDVHLCWGFGADSFSRVNLGQPLESGNGQPATKAVSESSVLQASVALLMDDWRLALRSLPVRFYAHRGRTQGQTEPLKKSEWRWKVWFKNTGSLPHGIAARFFERVRWTEVGNGSFSWQVMPEHGEWWCLCLLKSTLLELGSPQGKLVPPTTLNGNSSWQVLASALPKGISHLIVIDPAICEGSIYRVTRLLDRDEWLQLNPVERIPRGSLSSGPSFISLRTHALDVVLGVLESTAT